LSNVSNTEHMRWFFCCPPTVWSHVYQRLGIYHVVVWRGFSSLAKKRVNHLLSHPKQWKVIMEIYCLPQLVQLQLIASFCIVHKAMFHWFAPWVYRMQTHQCMPWMTKKVDRIWPCLELIGPTRGGTNSCNACRYLESMLYESSQLSCTFSRAHCFASHAFRYVMVCVAKFLSNECDECWNG